MNAKELVEQMSLEEKAGICSGESCWNLKSIPRLNIPTVCVMDGPHGLRKQTGTSDNFGVGLSLPAVCFPTASAIACSFDRELLYEVGKAIGEECAAEQVSTILGPGINMKRSPLCGRNFEYYSEDPVLSGELAAMFIQGVQSTGTFTSLKHFSVNNQEKRRMTVDAIVDERTLRETYLKAFEIAVKKGNPRTVMCSYNKINGTYASENRYLLQDILRKDWGFTGLVVSDWGAVHDRALGISCGLDLEMPSSQGINDRRIREAVLNQKLSMEDLNTAAERVTSFILEAAENEKNNSADFSAHHQLAVRAETESAVLLKNNRYLLPLDPSQKITVIGQFAKTPRFQGAGSSRINPHKVDTPWDALESAGFSMTYAEGYDLKDSPENEMLSRRVTAVEAAVESDVVLIFAGLPEGYESEGFDRAHMNLPREQNLLIQEVSKVHDQVAVILMGGAPISLPWESDVQSILMMYLGGEGCGTAVARLLSGAVNPSGRLAETWPLSAADTPCYDNFPGTSHQVLYREGIFIGYRYYEKAQKTVQYMFGHGLSYTDFAYSDFSIQEKTDRAILRFRITNTGGFAGRETSLIFSGAEQKTVYQPVKELRDFYKTPMLLPGENVLVERELTYAELGYFNTLAGSWYTPPGSYEILIGSSLSRIHLRSSLPIFGETQPEPDHRETAPGYYQLTGEFPVSEFQAVYNRPFPAKMSVSRPFQPENTLEDASHTLVARLFLGIAKIIVRNMTKEEPEQFGMMMAAIREMPFFGLVTSGDGILSEKMMDVLLHLINGKYGKALLRLLRKNK